jgi:hypothetical protein
MHLFTKFIFLQTETSEPFQVFLVSKTHTFMHEEKEKLIFSQVRGIGRGRWAKTIFKTPICPLAKGRT